MLPGWAVLGFGLAVSQVPLAALATANTGEAARGSTVTDQVHGLQAATIGTAAHALAGAVLAGLTLPRGAAAD